MVGKLAVSDLDGTLIALHRMDDGIVFSVDAAATCQGVDLNAVLIGTAVTNRTIGFGAQPFFPPGINASSPGPFFNIFLQDVAHPCTQGYQVPGLLGRESIKAELFSFLVLSRCTSTPLGVSGDGVDKMTT